jgi:hypothetical protein
MGADGATFPFRSVSPLTKVLPPKAADYFDKILGTMCCGNAPTANSEEAGISIPRDQSA